jgi:hypothetical protein
LHDEDGQNHLSSSSALSYGTSHRLLDDFHLLHAWEQRHELFKSFKAKQAKRRERSPIPKKPPVRTVKFKRVKTTVRPSHQLVVEILICNGLF